MGVILALFKQSIVIVTSGVFQPVKYKMYNHIDYYVDGALLCNYPIRCFDGKKLNTGSVCYTTVVFLT